MKFSLIAATAAFALPVSAEVYFKEQFNDEVSCNRMCCDCCKMLFISATASFCVDCESRGLYQVTVQ